MEAKELTIKDIEEGAISLVGTDKFYEVANTLKEELMSFRAYIRKNTKQKNFTFKITPVRVGTTNVFGDIMDRYYSGIEYIYEVYAIYLMIQCIIQDVYDDESPRKITRSNIRRFASWLYNQLGLRLEDYVVDFMGYSTGAKTTKTQLYKILHLETDEI